MSSTRPFAPLASIDAVVIDTETTGLDARTARIVQVGTVAITGGALAGTGGIDQIVDPGIAIPPVATRIHGIADTDVSGKPSFRELAPVIAGHLADRLVVGHSLAYDFAVLRNEHELAGLPWQTPRHLDVRSLGRVVAPGLADHSLDRLCDWLGVTNARRHSAMGDALATAEVFLKLVPLLREKGVRTLAEAEKACMNVAEADARAAGGLVAVDTRPAGAFAALAQLDVFAYRHRVRDVMSSPAMIVPASMTIAEAMGLMLGKGLSSVFVDLGAGRMGIMTERDALRAMHERQAAAFAAPVGEVAKHPLQSIPEDDHVYRAIGRLDRMGFRHLGVHDRNGRIVGALTPRNLLRNRATAAIAIGDGIAAATRPEDLARCWSDVPMMALGLIREGVEARTIAGVISSEIRAMTRRAAELAEAGMIAAGKGPAPVPYAILVLGSGGRGESLLAADQDNALVYANDGASGAADAWFAEMAAAMNATLDLGGITLCKGGVMARNSEWRGSSSVWDDRVAGWIRRQRPQDLLQVDIFFDADTVAGDVELGQGVLQRARERARGATDFLKMLTELARQWSSPLGLFGGFRKVDGRVDLKMGGLLPIFTSGRILALRHGIAEASTEARYRALGAAGIGAPAAIERIIAAQETLLMAVLRQQLDDGQAGIPLSPRVDVDRLPKAERSRIRGAIETVSEAIDLVSEGRL